MNADFISRWSGSPLITAPSSALERYALPVASREFLLHVGLPSNALWFDRSSRAIMCFDSVACLRELCSTDVSVRTWKAIRQMGRLIIIGIQSAAFIVADARGFVFLVQSDPQIKFATDPGWRAMTFVNRGADRFANCLVAYKEMVELINTEDNDFNRLKIREGVAKLRRDLAAADTEALAAEENYWSQILDLLDVW